MEGRENPLNTYHMNKKDAILVSGSSRGSQIKFYKDGYWYKIDEAGPEGIAEALVTLVLNHSSLSEQEYVKYEMCNIHYSGKTYKGCRSKNFLNEDEQFLSYEHIYQMLSGKNLSEEIIHLANPEERIRLILTELKERC